MPEPDDPRTLRLLPEQGEDLRVLGQNQSGEADRENGHDGEAQQAQHQQAGRADAQPKPFQIVHESGEDIHGVVTCGYPC